MSSLSFLIVDIRSILFTAATFLVGMYASLLNNAHLGGETAADGQLAACRGRLLVDGGQGIGGSGAKLVVSHSTCLCKSHETFQESCCTDALEVARAGLLCIKMQCRGRIVKRSQQEYE